MYLPLRMKFLLASGGVAIVALGSALWAVSYRLEHQLAGQIATTLLGAESTFTHWRQERESHLEAEARIVANDPRFFAAVAEGHAETTIPAAREFQRLAACDLFLVSDRRGARLAHLDENGESRPIAWPQVVPPSDDPVRWNGTLYLVQSQAVTAATDTVGYVGLGHRVDPQLAEAMGRVAGADVVFFEPTVIYGSTLGGATAKRLVAQLANTSTTGAVSDAPSAVDVDGERFLYRLGKLTPEGDVQYAVVMSLDERLNPQIADLRGTVALVGSIALLLAAAVSWTTARRVTARVPQLVAAVEAVARGDYEHAVIHEGRDELRAVAVAVDRMRHDLSAQMQEVARANAEKLSSERLAVVGKMAATIIHDFKTPMQVVRTAVELVSNDSLSSERRGHYADMVNRELDRMVVMAQDLLEFSRGERRMARHPVELAVFLDEAAAAWRQLCGPKGITVRLLPVVPVTLSVDRNRLRRALDNLVVNATEVLGEGGMITVTTRHDGEQIHIDVADTGPGIPSEIRDRIFEPFATFGKAQGTGLGLAMARKVVEDHGGAIGVESSPATGTTFTISLPCSRTERPAGNEPIDPPKGVGEYAEAHA